MTHVTPAWHAAGGRASVAVRRRKRDLRALLWDMCEEPPGTVVRQRLEEELKRLGLDPLHATCGDILVSKLLANALEGDKWAMDKVLEIALIPVSKLQLEVSPPQEDPYVDHEQKRVDRTFRLLSPPDPGVGATSAETH